MKLPIAECHVCPFSQAVQEGCTGPCECRSPKREGGFVTLTVASGVPCPEGKHDGKSGAVASPSHAAAPSVANCLDDDGNPACTHYRNINNDDGEILCARGCKTCGGAGEAWLPVTVGECPFKVLPA